MMIIMPQNTCIHVILFFSLFDDQNHDYDDVSILSFLSSDSDDHLEVCAMIIMNSVHPIGSLCLFYLLFDPIG